MEKKKKVSKFNMCEAPSKEVSNGDSPFVMGYVPIQKSSKSHEGSNSPKQNQVIKNK